MTKPWDETWEVHWDSDYVVTIKRDDGVPVGSFSAGGPEGVGRAKLAAAAPDLARVLRELAEEHNRLFDGQDIPAGYQEYVMAHIELMGRVDVVLRKAGAW